MISVDMNILPAYFHGEDATHLHLRLGTGLVSIERGRLAGGRHDGGRLDIYIRPEHIRLEPISADAVLTGTVVRHVFQGDHVDIYVDIDIPASGCQRVIVCSPGTDGVARWPIGTVTALALSPHDVDVFPPSAA
ncbi:MAG TPA: TOBE domain-containing protein [Bordetella sp.]